MFHFTPSRSLPTGLERGFFSSVNDYCARPHTEQLLRNVTTAHVLLVLLTNFTTSVSEATCLLLELNHSLQLLRCILIQPETARSFCSTVELLLSITQTASDSEKRILYELKTDLTILYSVFLSMLRLALMQAGCITCIDLNKTKNYSLGFVFRSLSNPFLQFLDSSHFSQVFGQVQYSQTDTALHNLREHCHTSLLLCCSSAGTWLEYVGAFQKIRQKEPERRMWHKSDLPPEMIHNTGMVGLLDWNDSTLIAARQCAMPQGIALDSNYMRVAERQTNNIITQLYHSSVKHLYSHPMLANIHRLAQGFIFYLRCSIERNSFCETPIFLVTSSDSDRIVEIDANNCIVWEWEAFQSWVH